MLTLKSIKMLQWAKRRRLDALEAALAQCIAALQVCADSLVRTQAHARVCEQNVTRGCDAFDRVIGAHSFRPENVLVLQHILDGLRSTLATANTETATALKQHGIAAEQLALARQQLQRLELQRDRLEERRIELLRGKDAEQEDTQDEESEEAAVSRMVSRRNESARALYAKKEQVSS
jgi:hypothetical protein